MRQYIGRLMYKMEDKKNIAKEPVPFSPRINASFDEHYHHHHYRHVYNFDRFIPFRPNLDIDKSYAELFSKYDKGLGRMPGQDKDERVVYYNRLLDSVLGHHNHRVLPTTQRHDSGYSSPTSPTGSFFNSSFEIVCSSPRRHSKRNVATSPFCILDMPNLRNDFYTNNLDWSSTNKIAGALHLTTYIWDATTTKCQKIHLRTVSPDNSYVSSLAWNKEGNKLVITDSIAEVLICDPEHMDTIQQLYIKENTHVGVVRWTDEAIFSGTRTGNIYIHDPRLQDAVYRLKAGPNEVCGLQVSEGTHYFAAGLDDGSVGIWDTRVMKSFRKIQAHKACTKALAWCPWRKSVLATGGGSNDGTIRLWQIHTGEKLGEVSTKSQTCGLIWSKQYHELASSHGSATVENNDIILWKMGHFQFELQARLRQHKARLLHTTLSPCATTIASVGADESLCLWNCFPNRSSKRRRDKEDSPISFDHYLR